MCETHGTEFSGESLKIQTPNKELNVIGAKMQLIDHLCQQCCQDVLQFINDAVERDILEVRNEVAKKISQLHPEGWIIAYIVKTDSYTILLVPEMITMQSH
jgi:hypothetical protein